MKQEFLNLAKQRRTIYALGKQVDFSNAELADLIKEAVKLAPTAFNSQSRQGLGTRSRKFAKGR